MESYRGAFSEVKQAKNRQTGQEVAVKIIDKASCAGKEGMIQTEVHILRQINHPHIIPLYDMYETEHNILLVMQM
jgi:calcium/calmodulin-dependent protein kinase I